MQGLKDLHTLCYAWRADAEVAWEGGGRFYPGAAVSFLLATETLSNIQQDLDKAYCAACNICGTTSPMYELHLKAAVLCVCVCAFWCCSTVS